MARRPRTQNPESAEAAAILQGLGEEGIPAPAEARDPKEPMYRIYEGSKIPVSKAVGRGHKRKWEAAKKAYEYVWKAWEEVFRYYNHNQVKEQATPRGHFRRGDMTENIVYSNINTVLPAIYSKNPDITCNTVDGQDEPLCRTMAAFINAIMRKQSAPGINLKPKSKKQAMMAELTNLGVMKLDFKFKDDSREQAVVEMELIKNKFAEAKDEKEVAELYGQLMALEEQAETTEPAGYKLT